MKKLLHFICIIPMFSCGILHESSVQEEIKKLASTFDGKVGVSIINLRTKEEIGVNENMHFPMQSVYKFPLAIAVFNQIDGGKLSLNQKLNLKKSDLLPNTHSPLRDLYPEGKKDITLLEILEKTVAQSDNNGCDFLFSLLGGTKPVDAFVKKLGVNYINIVGTEAEMHSDEKVQYANYASPLAMNKLLVKFYTQKTLSKKSTKKLWEIMVSTTTATNRIKGGLPSGTVWGHKSGWSGGDDRGFTNAINDAGIFLLPNGTPIAITVFIADTPVKSIESDKLAAKISKLAYDHFSK